MSDYYRQMLDDDHKRLRALLAMDPSKQTQDERDHEGLLACDLRTRSLEGYDLYKQWYRRKNPGPIGQLLCALLNY